jgi:predicted RNA-binding protein Jag
MTKTKSMKPFSIEEIKKGYVSYDTAKRLNELGFNESTIRVYDELGFIQDESKMIELELPYVKAPCINQAMRFLKQYESMKNRTTIMFSVNNDRTNIEISSEDNGISILITEDGRIINLELSEVDLKRFLNIIDFIKSQGNE